MKSWVRFVLSTALLLFAGRLSAATYIVPPDAELIRRAGAIAIVTIQSSQSYFTEDGRIATDYTAVVERALKGQLPAGAPIVITEMGGAVGDLAMSVSSSPRFITGERTLVMMERFGESRFTTFSGELGKFNFVTDAASRQLLVRGASDGEIFGWDVRGRRHDERPRSAVEFLRYIEQILGGNEVSFDYTEAADLEEPRPESHVPMGGNDYLTLFTIGSTTRGGRWPGGQLDMQSVGTQTGISNLGGAINTAAGAWTNAPNATIGLTYSGVASGSPTAAVDYAKNDGRFLMFFDQPNSGPLAGNVVGQANIWVSNAPLTNGSDTYFTAVDCDIIVEVGFVGSLFQEILAHEKGHCLGFRHSNQPGAGQTTTASAALMFSATNRGGPILGDWDRDAASHVYGSGAISCTPPSITSQPPNRSIVSGNSTSLSVSASGTAPLSYQWYIGSSGVTSNPVPGGTGTSINVSPTSTTSYWVRVTGQCGSPADSNAATVTVTACVPPSITSHPPARSITTGQSTSLSVTASGTSPFSYQWYIGNSGVTSNPVPGGTGSSINVSPSSTTSYWARVTGQCNPPADSNSATVTVTQACVPPAITTQPLNRSITAGQSTSLTVVATGTAPLSYQWYIGNSGVTSNPISGATAATVNVSPVSTTTYWVRVTGQCGTPASSVAVTVTVSSACTAAAITQQPQSVTIARGKEASLAVSAAGTAPFSHQWFTGTAGNSSNPIAGATSATLKVSPHSTTTYWVRVTGPCGAAAESTAATVTVQVGRVRSARH